VRDGWLHTGDLGYRDSEGFYFVVDRAKDMIIRGGENVYCTEIENCLADHPEIDEAAVVGVPDAELGERVKAIVRRVPGSALAESAVRAHVARTWRASRCPSSSSSPRIRCRAIPPASCSRTRCAGAAQFRSTRRKRHSGIARASRILERSSRAQHSRHFAKISIASGIRRSTLASDGRGSRCKETEVSVPPPKSSGRKGP
jgi:acyl-CoA synthetase (AMP-forming)/AMP-acid ligase II